MISDVVIELNSTQCLLREVLLNEPVTRREVASRLGLNLGTISRIVRPLIDAGLLREQAELPGARPPRPGRRFQFLEIDPRGGQVLGIAITPVLQTVVLANIGRNIIAGVDLVIEPITDVEGVIRRIAVEARRLIGIHIENRRRLMGALVLVTGKVDEVRGVFMGSPYLGWGRVPIRSHFEEWLNLPLQVRSLTPSLGIADILFGAARGRRHALQMLCGPGIGAAVLVDGRPVGESSFPIGAVGRMQMTGADGAVSTLDDLASGLRILRELRGEVPAMSLPQINRLLDDAIERDRAGDSQTAAVMARAGHELGRLVVQHGHFLLPDIVLIAGNLGRAPSYVAAARKTICEGLTPRVEVVPGRGVDATGGMWVSCCMAVYEYLVEQHLNVSDLGPKPYPD